MGEYVRTYRFTGQDNTSGPRSVDFSRFQVVGGDTEHKIARILAMNYIHWHTSDGSQNWALRGRLVLDDGTTFVTDEVNNHIRGEVVEYINNFTTLPTPEQFEKIQKVQTLDTQDKITSGGYSAKLFWRANATYPMTIHVAFSDIPEVQTSGIKSVNNITLDGKSAVKVSIDKLTERARHTVEWQLGDYSFTSDPVDTEASFTPPLEWLNAVTDSKTGTGKVIVRTYPDENLEVQIGEDVAAEFVVTVPDSMRPTVEAGWATAMVHNTGQAAGIDNYIQGYSRVKLEFDPDKITTLYGASIAGYTYTVQNTTVTAEDHVSGLLKVSGESQIICTVTDSRGMTNDVSLPVAALSINVLPYAEPKMNAVTVLRSENEGPPTDGVNGDVDGRYIYAVATAVTSEGVGLKSLILMYREKGFTSYTSVSLNSGVAKVIPGLLDSRTYELVLMVTDRLSNSYSQSFLFAHKQLSFNIKDGGKAIGIGTAAGDDNTMRLGWKVIFEEGFESFVPVLPVGACVMLDSSMDPVAQMGGEWAEISWSGAPSGVKLWKRTK